MTYEQEATALMQMPKFIAAKNAYIVRVLEVRTAMQNGATPSQRTMTELSKLENAMRETTGLATYKKTWKIIIHKIAAEYAA